MRVGYYSPLPPERSGIADYSALLLPALERRLEVEVVRPGRRLRRPSFDLALYHLGNNPEGHGWILEALRERRGLVVLHEFVLHHLVAGVTLGRGDAAGYLDAMQREAGVVGRMLAHGVIDGLVPPLWERRPADFPLAREVLIHADGLVVHSRYVEQRVREAGYTGPVWRIPMPAWPGVDAVPARLPRAGKPLIGCFGVLNPARRVPQLLEAFGQLRRELPDATLVFAGGASGIELEREAKRAGVDDAAVVRGWVDVRELWSLLSACDVCVALRWPTMGETSAIVVRALSAGTPLVVSDVGWFTELPDDVALKVPIDAGEVEALTAALRRIAADPGLRERMSAAALELARSEHELERVADAYAAACEEAAGRRAVEDGVLGQVAAAAADVGIAPNTTVVREVAAATREITRGD
jgi:glycosyltransferase involved in cell wall biosynthesis